jgi:hypothetical protein
MALWQVLQASDPAYCSPSKFDIITFFCESLDIQQLKTVIHKTRMLVKNTVRL